MRDTPFLKVSVQIWAINIGSTAWFLTSATCNTFKELFDRILVYEELARYMSSMTCLRRTTTTIRGEIIMTNHDTKGMEAMCFPQVSLCANNGVTLKITPSTWRIPNGDLNSCSKKAEWHHWHRRSPFTRRTKNGKISVISIKELFILPPYAAI